MNATPESTEHAPYLVIGESLAAIPRLITIQIDRPAKEIEDDYLRSIAQSPRLIVDMKRAGWECPTDASGDITPPTTEDIRRHMPDVTRGGYRNIVIDAIRRTRHHGLYVSHVATEEYTDDIGEHVKVSAVYQVYPSATLVDNPKARFFEELSKLKMDLPGLHEALIKASREGLRLQHVGYDQVEVASPGDMVICNMPDGVQVRSVAGSGPIGSFMVGVRPGQVTIRQEVNGEHIELAVNVVGILRVRSNNDWATDREVIARALGEDPEQFDIKLRNECYQQAIDQARNQITTHVVKIIRRLVEDSTPVPMDWLENQANQGIDPNFATEKILSVCALIAMNEAFGYPVTSPNTVEFDMDEAALVEAILDYILNEVVCHVAEFSVLKETKIIQ